jgi:antitoxin (DNA-binding transcriptional repressor) of toxin-antitoxin stability system
MTASQTITVQEAQSHLADIIDELPPGAEIVITCDGKAVATLRAIVSEPSPKPRQLGTLKGSVLYIAADFEAIPEGFRVYVE